MYNNIGKRDILIFPKFDNIDKLQEIRQKYDRLADKVCPHITLVFPFSDSISDEELTYKLYDLLSTWSPFRLEFKGVSLSDDGYIFLDCTNGYEELIKLHDVIYEKILPSHYKKSIKYVPHITLGQADSLEGFEDFNFSFSCMVNEVSLELIGENEESIIIQNISLKEF